MLDINQPLFVKAQHCSAETAKIYKSFNSKCKLLSIQIGNIHDSSGDLQKRLSRLLTKKEQLTADENDILKQLYQIEQLKVLSHKLTQKLDHHQIEKNALNNKLVHSQVPVLTSIKNIDADQTAHQVDEEIHTLETELEQTNFERERLFKHLQDTIEVKLKFNEPDNLTSH